MTGLLPTTPASLLLFSNAQTLRYGAILKVKDQWAPSPSLLFSLSPTYTSCLLLLLFIFITIPLHLLLTNNCTLYTIAKPPFWEPLSSSAHVFLCYFWVSDFIWTETPNSSMLPTTQCPTLPSSTTPLLTCHQFLALSQFLLPWTHLVSLFFHYILQETHSFSETNSIKWVSILSQLNVV